MFKQIVGRFLARLLRAALGRIVTDLELIRTIKAASTSADLINLLMDGAEASCSREEVMQIAFNAAKLEGIICEFGVYRGHSLNEIAKYYSKNEVHGFDTFTGLPEFWRDGFPEGAFDVTSQKLFFEKNCVLHKGLFDETLPIFLNQVEGVAKFIHIDCDLYSSTISALQKLASRICVGTVIVFDEYLNYPGWENHEHKAFCEFLLLQGLGCNYLTYNKFGQQVAIIITKED